MRLISLVFLVIGVAIGATLAGRAPAPALPEPAWDYSGEWVLVNKDGYRPILTVTHVDGRIQGTARLDDHDRARAGLPETPGTVAGSIVGDHVHMMVTWPPKLDGRLSVGHYEGTLRDGRIDDGQAFDAANPDRRGTFFTTLPRRVR